MTQPSFEQAPIHVRGRAAIGRGLAPYVISEIGTNHDRDLEKARELVRQTAAAGCDCAKFQIYEADEIVSAGVRSGAYGLDAQYGDISAQSMFADFLKTPKEWFPELRDLCHELGMDCCVTIHGEHGLRWAQGVGVDIIKLASMDHTNLPFMRSLVGAVDAPILASFGMAALEDMEAAIAILREHPAGFVPFHCVAVYPPNPDEVHLHNIPFMREHFGMEVGFSDHTVDVVTCVAAVGLGAVLFEKHFTLDRTADGPDHPFALEPADMAAFVTNIKEAHRALGPVGFTEASSRERANRAPYLKSVIVRRALPAGHVLTEADVYLARPGTGLRPDRVSAVVGRPLLRDVSAEVPLVDGDVDVSTDTTASGARAS